MTVRDTLYVPSEAQASQSANLLRRAPRSTFAGLALVAIWWTIAWLQVRPFSDYSFFPLWLGYIFTVDGLVRMRTGTSPVARNGTRFGLLFVSSIGLWWVFEALNEVIDNWLYLTPRDYTALEYGLLASIAFSTVTPAVLTTAELVRSFRWNPLCRLRALRQTRRFLLGAHLAGWGMLAAVVFLPDVAFPLVWLSLIFLLDPLVTVLGGQSIGRYVEQRDWSPVFNLALGTVVCGWFWEMWNYYSLPKWEYTVPYAEYGKVFEMPLLGYGGYIPFGIEVFVFYQLLRALLRRVPFPSPRVSLHDAANVRGEIAIETPETARL